MNYIYLALLSLAFIAVECLIGGTRLIFSLPVYAVLGLASILTLVSIAKAPKIRPKALCLISSGLFFGYILVRTWWSPVDYLARWDFMMVLGAVAVYLLTALYFVKSQYRMYLTAVLLAIAVGQAALGLYQYARGNDYMLFGFTRWPNENRASGMYQSPNHLAGYLEVMGIIGMSLVFWSTWRPWAKILAGYASMVAFIGVLITGSRGGYLSMAFCLLVFFAIGIVAIKMAYPERLLRVVLIGGAVILVLGGSLPFLITSSLVKRRTAQIVDVKNMRIYMWQAAWEETKLAPAFGTGSGTYLYYGRKFRDPSVQNDPIRVHNDYLDLLAEYGIVGVAGFLLFLGAHLANGVHTFFWLVRKRLQFSPDWRSSSLALNIGCLCAVAAYLVHSIFDFNLHIPANCLLMAFVFGMLANPGLETSHEKKVSTMTARVFQFVLPAFGIAILAIGLPRIPGEYYAEKARVALKDGRYFEAKEAAQAGISREKKNPDLFYYLGESERHVGDIFPAAPQLAAPYYEAASDAFKQGFALFPEDSRLLLIEGWTLDALGRHDEADSYFKQAVEWDPNSDEVRKSVKSHMDTYMKPTAP